MSNLKDIVYCSEEQLNTMASGTPVGDHVYDENDLYITPLGDDIIVGADNSGTKINENNELIVDSTFIKDAIPLGSYGTAGLVMINPVSDEGVSESISGLRIRNGKIHIMPAATIRIDDRKAGYYSPIVPSNLDYAVKVAMTDGKGAAWTNEEKIAARERMGINDAITEALAAIGVAEERSY